MAISMTETGMLSLCHRIKRNTFSEPVALRHLKRRHCETILGGKNLGYFSFELFPLFSLFDTVYYKSAMTCLNSSFIKKRKKKKKIV